MNIPLLLTTIAGFSTLLGGLFILFCNNINKDKVILSSLAFASSVMILISFTDLIPESFKMFINDINIFPSIILILIFINIGIIISELINKFVNEDKNELYRVGVISMLAIIIHNIPEGMATFIAGNTNLNLGISLTIAISLHNIPEGISIAVPIYYSTKSKTKALLYTLISGLSELLGALITLLFLKPFINNTILAMLFSLIAGIMLYISIVDLLFTSISYNNKRLTIIYFLLGICFVIISTLV